MDDFQFFINSLRGLEQSHNPVGAPKEESLKSAQGAPKCTDFGSPRYIYISLTSPTAQSNAESRLFLSSLRANITLFLTCKQSDARGLLSPRLVQLAGVASALL